MVNILYSQFCCIPSKIFFFFIWYFINGTKAWEPKNQKQKQKYKSQPKDKLKTQAQSPKHKPN